MNQHPWMAQAWAELGVAENPGTGTNPRVTAYYRDAGSPGVRDDAVPWCAAFAGACLERAGVRSSRSLAARSYLAWGEAADPSPGVVCVLSRGSDPAAGHVGFLVGMTDRRVVLLGGNQGDAVTVAAFDRARVLGFRLPGNADPNGEADPGASSCADVDREPLFNAALAMVLRFEGGWSDDPYDPGGPTNRGITLATYAREKGVTVTPETRDHLVTGLRAISDDLVRRIYLERYWRPASCPDLPSGIAVFHFDTAVNMGVGTAARMLQQALGVEADGEIGPITRTAAAAAEPDAVLSTYAGLRRQRYRSLATFWRFGRGWLSRNHRALAEALRLSSGPHAGPPDPAVSNPQQKKGTSMSAEQPFGSTGNSSRDGEASAKWWGQSLTIWGALVTGLSTVAPAVLNALGLDLSVELAQRLSQDVVTLAQALGGLLGTVMTIAGRLRASTRIQRRPVALRI